LALDVVVNIILNSLLQFPRGLGKNIIYSIGSFLSAAITVALNVLFIAVFSWGAYGLFIATIFSKIATAIYLIFAMKAWKFFSLREVDFQIFNKVFKYSIPLVPNQLSWWVVGASDRTIVSKYIGVATNGIYSVANKFPSVFTTFYNIFNLSWTESVSLHMNDADRDEFLTDTINTMFNLFAAIDIGIIACMPFIFNLLINKQYDDAYFQIPILMIAVIFQVVVGLYSVIYVALKKSSEIAKTSLFAAIINIVVDLALIRVIGLYAVSGL
jgi:O-antigen/teichoic acid export membrane protein